MDKVNSIIKQLIELIDRKLELLVNIKSLTQEEQKCIEESGGDNVNAILDKKQLLIDNIDEIDKSFADAFDQLKHELKVKSLEEVNVAKYPELEGLKLKVGNIMSISKELMVIEEANRDKLNSALDDLKKEMKLISTGKRSIKAYESPIPYNDGIYIDKKK